MTSIFVAKLDFGITSDQLKEAFQQYGTVLKATVATDRETGKSRGFGFVEMANKEEAMEAIKNLDGYKMNGRPIAVKEAEQRQDNRPPRDNSNSGRPFQPRNNNDRRDNRDNRDNRPPRDNNAGSDYKKPVNDGAKPFSPPPATPDALKNDTRKAKEKDRKGKDWDAEGRQKKPKMNAHKKSGKNNRFFDDDEEEDFDLFAYKGEEDEDDFVDEFDEDYEDDYENDYEDDYEDED